MTRNCIVCQGNAEVYCFNDEAYLCSSCDEQVHGVNLLARRHNRVRVCELCTAEPSAVYCKNDRAYLCSACDASSHSSIVASRHERVPVAMSVEQATFSEGCSQAIGGRTAKEESVEVTDDDSFLAVPDIPLDDPAVDAFPEWAAPGDTALFGKGFESNDLDIFDMSPAWLDRLETGLEDFPSSLMDGVVPEVCDSPLKPEPVAQRLPDVRPESRMAPKIERQHAVPLHLSNEMATWGVQQDHAVPTFTPVHMRMEGSENTSDSIDINNYVPHSFLPMDPRVRAEQARDRRARLERFREKKKNRQFKKTIRYASRKAYAEVRPRIKGRFARKDEVAAMRAAGLLPPVAAA